MAVPLHLQAFADHLDASIHAVIAAGEHYVVAFRIAPLRISIKIKVTPAHAIRLVHSGARLRLVKPVAAGDPRDAIRFIRVDEHGEHVLAIPQQRRGAAADDDAAALVRSVQNGLLFRIVDELALRIERAADARAVRKHVAREKRAGADGLFILPLHLAERNAAFLRRLLEQQLIVTGHAQPRRQLFADFAAAASILSADANNHIVHMNPSSSERRA